jgi:hypothetical protein
MFFPPGFKPEMMITKPTFEQYYKKRLSEEYAKLAKCVWAPSSYTAELTEYVKAVARKEYDKKYPN